MVNFFRFVCSVIFLLFCSTIEFLAQAPRDPVATGVLQRSAAAMGYVQGLSCTTTAHLTFQSDPAHPQPLVLKSRGNSSLRTELQTPKGTRVMVVTSGNGRMQAPNGKITTLSSFNTRQQVISHLPAFSLISLDDAAFAVDPALSDSTGLSKIVIHRPTANSSASVTGTSSVATTGPSLQTAAVSQADQGRLEYYVDPVSFLVRKLVTTHYSEQSENQTQQLEIRYDGYKLLSGIMVPVKQQILQDGKAFAALEIDQVDCSTQLSDATFDLPTGGTK